MSLYYFLNPTELDLSRYQIFPSLEEAVDPINQHHSLRHALVGLGLHNTSLDHIINGRNFYDQLYIFPQRHLTLIARKIQRNIRLTYYIKDYGNKIYTYYPSRQPYEETIYLARFMNHYMIDDRLGQITTFYLIKELVLRNKLNLVKIPNVFESRPILINLSDVIGEQKEFGYKSTVKRYFKTISYADTESLVHGRHLPFLVGKYCQGKFKSFQAGPKVKDHKFLDVIESIISEEDIWSGLKRFLESYPDGTNLVYFHNLQYDWFNIKKAPFIYIRSVMKKDSIYYSVTFSYYRKTFELRDSYKHVPKPLSDFPSTFGLTAAKHEYIIYKLYTLLNITKQSVSYRPCQLADTPEQVLNTVKGMKVVMDYHSNHHAGYILVDERIAVSNDFLDLCQRFIAPDPTRVREGEYYHIRHYKYYLKLDCTILADGMAVYKKRMKSILGVSCHDKYTLPSTVHYSLCESGCYEGIYEVSESLRAFIGRSVHGGRVLSMHNKMWDIRAKSYVLDARSLYPSAIDRICRGEVGGFPTGPAECITDWKLRDTYDHYVARISITAITKSQQLPFVTYRTKYGREYTSSMTELGGQDSLNDLVVDKITLEDWVKFQGIEYTFIEGIGWNQGTNAKYGACVKHWYNTRRECIETGNVSMSELWKLCLNSSYGKTISKPMDTKVVVKPRAKALEYEAKNASNLCDKEECSNSVIYSVMTDDFNHSNMSHVGGMILSMSRRIMNEVLDVCNDIAVPALYTDTDSIHIVDSLLPGLLLELKPGEIIESGLSRLQQAYALRYDRDLLGTNLGQFSLELKFPGHTNIRSERAIFLGKKVYVHEVYGENSEGVTESYGLTRAKGISRGAFEEHIKQESDKIDLYHRMYEGETIPFNLAYYKPVFKYDKRGVSTTDTSIRKINFTGVHGTIGI